MRLTLLHNASSGDEDHDRRELEALLATDGHDVTYRSLGDDDWRDVFAESGDLIVVAGGDGSVRRFLTAIDRQPILARVVPVGSANNIARALGLDFDAAMALPKAGAQTNRSPFDLWDVRSTWGASRCVEAAGGGLFADVLVRAEDARADPTGDDKVDFGLELLARTLGASVPRRWSIEVDGSRSIEELIGLEAMNIREIGANLPFAPGADPGDGCIDVVLVRPEDRAELTAYVAARLADDDADPPSLETRRGRHVILEPPGEVRLHVDDMLPAWDLSTTRWIEITRADVQIDLLVPRDE